MKLETLKKDFSAGRVKFRIDGNDVTLSVTYSVTIPIDNNDVCKTFDAAVVVLLHQIAGTTVSPF